MKGLSLFAMLLGLVLIGPVYGHDTVYYYSSDQVQSEVVITDASRNVVEQTHYAPYGQVLNRTLRDGPGYTGHEEDPETSLVYMQQRYYDPECGRFVSSDSVVTTDDGGGFNRYAYVYNDPLGRTDPSGNCPSCLIGALVEVGFEAYTGELNNAFSQAFEGHYGALAVSAAKIGVAAISGGVSTVAAARAISLAGKAAEVISAGKAATVVVKVAAVATTQAASGAATQAANNAVEGKPLGEDVGTAAAASAVAGTVLKYAGDAVASRAGDVAEGAGGALGANLKSGANALTKVVTGEVKKEVTCTVKHGNPC